MAVFDRNVKDVFLYTCAISDVELKHEIFVSLVKSKAYYRGVDVFEKFYTNPYSDGNLVEEKHACEYLIVIPLLQKLYDVAVAHGKENSVRFGNCPNVDEIDKIKRKIESI